MQIKFDKCIVKRIIRYFVFRKLVDLAAENQHRVYGLLTNRKKAA